jgi:hypothetical protein
VVQTEKDAKRIFPKKYGMIYTTNYMVWKNIPCRGWDLEKTLSLKP